MSEFLMVIPEGWSEVPDASALVDAAGGIGQVQDYINQNAWGFVDSVLEPVGLPESGMTTSAARLFQTDGGVRLWVQFAPA